MGRSAASSSSTVAMARAVAAAASGDALEPRVEEHELAAREVGVDGLALGHQPDLAIHLGMPPGRDARHRHAPGRWLEQARDEVQQRGLAGAVGTQQAGHAGRQRAADVVDRDHVAVPARDVVDHDARRPRPALRRRRWRSHRRRSALIPRSAGSAGWSGPSVTTMPTMAAREVGGVGQVPAAPRRARRRRSGTGCALVCSRTSAGLSSAAYRPTPPRPMPETRPTMTGGMMNTAMMPAVA